MKKVIIAMLLVALFVVPAFAIYWPEVLTATVGFGYDKDGFAFKSVKAEFKTSETDFNYGVSYTFGDLLVEDGFHVGASYSTDTNNFGTIEATLNLADSIYNFKADSIELSYGNTGDFLNSYGLGFKYSFDKDPAKTGLNFTATKFTTVTDCGWGNKFLVEGKIHRINDQLKLEDFEAAYAFVDAEEDPDNGLSVAFKYSYDDPAEVNGIYASEFTTNTEIGTSVTASVHKVNDKFAFEVNKVALTYDLCFAELGASYVYSFANDAAGNGFFGNVSCGSFSADFKVEDWKIADWSLEDTVEFPFPSST